MHVEITSQQPNSQSHSENQPAAYVSLQPVHSLPMSAPHSSSQEVSALLASYTLILWQGGNEEEVPCKEGSAFQKTKGQL